MSENSPSNRTSEVRNRPSTFRRWKGFLGYWFRLITQPILAVAFVVALAWLFGYVQRNYNWFNDAASSVVDSESDQDALYACSMLCVFVKAPGRCPVCGMELQQIEMQGDPKDLFGVTIDPTARRLANIKTSPALNIPMSKQIEVLGRVTYDETTEATLSAYVDGRVEDLVANFTGARVKKDEALAVLYSPDLYSDQVGLLLAKEALEESVSSPARIINSNQRLYQSARRRLIEFGIPENQVDEIEKRGKPQSRIQISAPISGTVIKKMVDEGDYVKKGAPLFKLVDLSTVWLMLEMYPEDTANLQLGQTVTVNIRSQVGKAFQGTIAFIDPLVNQDTNTLDVRVEIPNEAGLIKIGEFGNAMISTNLDSDQDRVVVPRESVLINGDHSIAYVETEPGRFEFRKVEIAEVLGDKIALKSGVEAGEMVVASGVFMLDSTFNIQGKVSLIDPNRAELKNQSELSDSEEEREIEKALSELSEADRSLAERQVICPVTEVKLGSAGMGVPIRVVLPQRDVMICCEGCRQKLVANPEPFIALLDQYQNDAPTAEEQAEIEKAFAPLSKTDRQLAEAQVICPVTEVRLGTMGMGTPINVDVNGRPVMICCEGCRKQLLADPETNFQILQDYHDRVSGKTTVRDPQAKLPKMELPKMELPKMELPKMELPK